MKRWIALSLVFAAPRLALGATDPTADARARVTALGLPPADTAALLAPLQHAEAARLPTGPVAAKILEGLAKHVAPARIGAAAEQVVSRLGDAQAALDAAGVAPGARESLLSELALTEVRLGARAQLLQLATEARGATAEGLVAAAGACADLEAQGVPEEHAAQLLGTLAARGYDPEQISAVPRLLQQYRAEGGSDVGAFVRELEARGAQHGELRDAVDPFAPRGDPLNRSGRSRETAPGKSDDRGNGGRPLAEDPQRGGSTPAADDDLATRTGRGNVGHPPNGTTGGGGKGNGKGNGKGGGNVGNQGHDPGQE